MKAERFRPIPGLEGQYEISRNAEIRSLSRPYRHGYGLRATSILDERILKPTIHDGRPTVMLPSEPVLSCGKMVSQSRVDTYRKAYEAWIGPIPLGDVVYYRETGAGDVVDFLFVIPRSLLCGLVNPHERARDRAEARLRQIMDAAPEPALA